MRDSRAVSGGATTTFTWDIASGLPVVLDDGNQYVYGAGLTSMKQSGSWVGILYYLADGLGSTMAVVDSSGTSQKSYTYDVYGEATPSGGLANEFDFAGQQTDGTGLQYLRARYYDPETGTFLSREPLATEPAWLGEPYAYAACDPTNTHDPTGLIPTKKWCKEQWQDVKSAIANLKKRIRERDAAPVKDANHAKSIEQAASHLKDEMQKFSGYPSKCDQKKFRPDDFDRGLWEEGEELVKEYAPQEASLWKRIKEKFREVPDLPEVPNVWYDGDPVNPWWLPVPGGGRGPIIN